MGRFPTHGPVTDLDRTSNYSVLHVYLSRDAKNGLKRKIFRIFVAHASLTALDQTNSWLKAIVDFTKREQFLRWKAWILDHTH